MPRVARWVARSGPGGSVSERVVELPRQAPSEFERTPPQDLHAEQSVLGGMLLSKDAIADVVEVLRSTDFYKPAHQTIYDIVLDLYGRGEPADAVTVAGELTRTGDLGRIGGAPYLHTLLSSVPTAANAGYYAKIVSERAILRRLVEAGTRVVQLGYASDGGEVDDLVDRAQQAIYDVTERRSSEDYTVLADVMQPAMDEMEAISSRAGTMTGVPTGFADLDQLTNGLHPGQLIVIAGRPGLGKALALDTPLPTPGGWTTMGEVKVGDALLGADGRPTTVLAATAVLTGRPCFAVSFDDGSVLVADAEHQWEVDHGRVLVTRELLAGHAVRSTAPLELPAADLPLPPYSFGAWLAGEQGLAGDRELAMLLDADGGPLTDDDLEAAGLHQCGGLPPSYLRASVAQRRALLAGLLDVGGLVLPDGRVELAATLPRLVCGMHDLVVGLGYVATVTDGAVSFATDHEVFRLASRQLVHKEAGGRHVSERIVTDVRAIASRPVRCVEVDAADHLYLAGRAMVPTHNSTLGLDIARSCSVKHSMTSAIFSLEMTKTEITMRLLSAEARIGLASMRNGTMSDDDWARLARRMGEVADAPLFIDDSPNLSMMEIRAKARRLRQRHDLKLVVIDYLQLMSGNKKAESRQQEVSELSRNLKLLAKELEVPVIAMSQLNRGPEQRTDKRPQLSDLRESGCLPASTRILRADNGREVTLGELFASDARDVAVWSLDDSLRYVRRHLTHVFATGTKPVFRLTLRSGKQVRATANHPFLTFDGWRPLETLAPGVRLAVPRHVPAPESDDTSWPDEHVVLLAHLIGDGSFVRRQPLRYASVDEANLAAVTQAAAAFDVTPVREDYAAARSTTLRLRAPYRLARGVRNPIAAWLDGLGLFGLRSHEKFVPAAVAGLPKRQIRLFLRHLWATAGSVTVNGSGRGGRVYYASTSLRLCEDVSRLLLRFGISTRLRTVGVAEGVRPQYTLDISGVDDQRRFLSEIGVHGTRGTQVTALLAHLDGVRAHANVDTVPVEVWDRVKALLTERQMSHREFTTATGTSFGGSSTWKHAPSRERLGRVAALLEDRALDMLATNDVLWDEVVSIKEDGVEEVYDATVVGTHNFIADGVAVHNSIEQDADMVILLHREDAYEKESPRAGEADFIVAKHRNGPTDTITVAFQGHYSRFVDMT
ncbi:MAG: replicative helicase, partial [Frankiales bacterium]|nr:replicative helicase [Frankiales bacterium]